MEPSRVSSSAFHAKQGQFNPLSQEQLEQLAKVLNISQTTKTPFDLQQQVFDSLLKTFRQKNWAILQQNSSLLHRLTDRWGKTLLMQAAINWDQETVQQLIQYKVSIYDVDGTGNTALHHAARSGAFELLDLLSQHLSIQTKNKLGETPLHVAIMAGQDEIVQYFLRKGASIKEGCPLPNSSYSISALPLSVKEGELGCFHALMEAKADLKEYTPGLGTILHITVIYRQTELLKKLFRIYPSEVKTLLEIPDDQGLTPFNLAARHGDTDALTIFEENGAKIDSKDKDERYPLHHAVLGQQHLAVLWLVYLGCRLRVVDQNGDTPLSLAKKIVESDNTHTSYSIRNYLQNALGQEQSATSSDTKPFPLENLVLQAAGESGQIYLGPLKYLQNNEVLKNVKRIAATSFSSVMGALVAVGYTVENIIEIMSSPDLTAVWNHPLQDKPLEQAIADPSIQILHQRYLSINSKMSARKVIQKLEDAEGVCSLAKFREKIDQLIAAQVTKITGADLASCTNLTFGELDLLVKANKAKALFIVATQAESDTQSVVFSSEDPEWNDLVISDAIVASMAIPGVFKQHTLYFKDKQTSNRYPRSDKGQFIDGGVACHFPIKLFDSPKYLQSRFVPEPKPGAVQFNPRTVGLKIASSQIAEEQPPMTLKELLKACSLLYYKSLESLKREETHNRVVELEDQYLSSSLEKPYDKAESVLKSKLFTNENYLLRDLLQFQNKISLPRPLDSFVGRINLLRDLENICLTKAWKQATICPLPHVYGLAGLGKSETSIMFANRHLDKFWLVWFIRCENSFSYDNSYRFLAERLKIPLDKETSEQIVEKVHMKLANSEEEKPWLLILDSVETSISMPERGGVVLTTSQHEKIHKAIPAPLPIKPFDFAETKEYFKSVPKEKLDQLEKLHEEFGGWPVLVAQARVYMQDAHCSVTEYLKELQSIDLLFQREEHSQYPRSLGQAFEMTLNRLVTKSKEAVELLYTCAYLNYQEIQLEIFKSWIKDTPVRWKKEVLRPLEDLSIIRFDEQKQSFSIQHRLWQVFLKKKLEKEVKAEEQFLKTVELLYQIGKEFDHKEPKTWNKGNICSYHVEIEGGYWDELDLQKRSLLLDAAGKWFMTVKGNASAALKYLQKALAIWEKALPHNYINLATIYVNLATSYNNVGSCLINLGEYKEALKYLQKAVAIWEKVLPPDHPNLAENYNNVGSCLMDLGEYKEALKYNQKALAIFEKVLPPNHPNLAISYGNIGGILRDLREHKEALKYRQKALAICEKMLPPDHPDLATSYDNIGSCLMDLGEHKEALKYRQKALAIREKVLPPDHPNLAESYNGVGLSLGDLGERKEALKYQQKALAICEKMLPPNHPNLATSYNRVGGSLRGLGEHKEALKYNQKALAIWEKVLPPNHPNLATGYNNVGLSLGDLGEHKEALKYLQKALAIREKALPPDHPNLAESYNNVGSSLMDLGEHKEALKYRQKALAIREKVLPPDHPNLAESYNGVGSSLMDLGEHKEALKYNRKALAIWEKVLPPDHPDLVASYNNVGLILMDLGEHKEALKYNRKALAIWEKVLPPDHPNLAASYNNVGASLRGLGEHKEALKYLQKALIICAKMLPPDHPNLAASYNNVGSSLEDLGEHKEALKYLQKALAIKEKVLPPDHPNLATSYNRVGAILMDLGERKEALKYLQKALEIFRQTLGEKHPNTIQTHRNVESCRVAISKQLRILIADLD